MIFITGDCHGDMRRFSKETFFEQTDMGKQDTVIICGDFGLVWDYAGESPSEKYWLDWLENKPFTAIFVDGNHECFTRLNSYPVSEWHGGKVHAVRPSVLHLMRGEVFELEGLKIWAFGGASSHDIRDGIIDPEKDPNWRKTYKQWEREFKMFRVNGVSWWEEELPSEEEMENGRRNMAKAGNKVDFLITHSPSASEIALLGHGAYKQDILTRYLEDIRASSEYKKHFCGHMHVNKVLNDRDLILYEQIIRIH